MAVITFRPLGEADLSMFVEWLTRPHVREWWHDGPFTVDEAREDYLDQRDHVSAYIALADGEPVAFIQSYVAARCGGGWWEDVTDPGVIGIDQFIADAHNLGRGLGTQVVKAFVDRLLADANVSKVQTDPDPANARAIRCYEKAGFRAVRDIVTPDGRALLMVIDKRLRIRPPIAADVGAITRCVCAAYLRYIERIGRQPWPMLQDYRSVIESSQVHIAERAGQVVGVLELKLWEEGLLLDSIAVDPAAQGTGVGRLLLEFAESEARRQGFPAIHLMTNEKMTENQALYANIGYVEYDRQTVDGYSRVLMRKNLS